YINWRVTNRDKEIVSQVLVAFGLERLAFRPFSELSGGEKQKAILARALAQEPEVLLLDEPTSNLDIKHQLEALNLISWAAREKNFSVIMTTHDLNLASRYSDKVILLKEGRIYAIGSPREVIVPANIKSVYDVEAIVNNDSGSPFVIPVSASKCLVRAPLPY
ncbi:MAG: ABC transporter ATP-binding protein, partial [Chloroflexota bacterium]|nr:ABC transporter ATP-binding protein [Chloroflexota bacterium]